MRHTLLLLTLAACTGAHPATGDTDGLETDASETDIPVGTWNPRLPEASAVIAPLRGRIHQRAVFHLHSPWSHDACDNGHGADNPACQADLRRGLCTDRYDYAFLTDHPDYGDSHTFEELFHPQEGDELVRDGDDILESRITCDDGHVLHWRAGFEDELMPVGLRHHVDPDQATRHDILNRSDADAITKMRAAGGWVFQAHTEGKELTHLEELQDAGLHSVEAFNAHAAFAPNIRGPDLGLDPLGWAADIGPFVSTDPGYGQPDLLFLGVFTEHTPSVQKWDALLQRGPMMATAGCDGHQNVLNVLTADGERVDSYRRMLRWFSNMVIADDASQASVDAAIEARRVFLAFEVLGTPTGFDFHLEDGTDVYEMGSDAPVGNLVVACPTLAKGSPHGAEAPEITVTVFKDGAPWQTACGNFPATKGVYRVRVDITPVHFKEFLGTTGDTFLKPFPWIYSGAIRVAMDG